MTSSPHSTILIAFWRAISATLQLCCGSSSKFDAYTSPLTNLFISVTSSGLSPTNTTINFAFGWFLAIPFAISFRSHVFPALGGETTIDLWPKPIGESKSIILVDITSWSVSNLICLFGNIGVNFLKFGLLAASAAGFPYTVSTLRRLKYFSLSFGSLAGPVTSSPVLRLNFWICEPEIYTSLSPGKRSSVLNIPWDASFITSRIPLTSTKPSLLEFFLRISIINSRLGNSMKFSNFISWASARISAKVIAS